MKAPSNQRGRDFAIMLAAFNQLGYSVEWRVINAADYGRAQRRRRVFFFVFRNDTKWGERLHTKYEATLSNDADLNARLDCYAPYIFEDGLFGRQFPVKNEAVKNVLMLISLMKILQKYQLTSLMVKCGTLVL